jgi:hypothetical protein
MLCSRRGMHPMGYRIACDLSAVRYHGIYRKLSGDMLGACACISNNGLRLSAWTRKEDPPVETLSENASPWCISAKSHRRGHRQKNILWNLLTARGEAKVRATGAQQGPPREASAREGAGRGPGGSPVHNQPAQPPSTSRGCISKLLNNTSNTSAVT